MKIIDTNKKRNIIKKPFFALAPMANITTYPFASQCVKYGADLVWTPMVHTDTIINNWPEAEKILNFAPLKNYVIQIIGSDPEKIISAIKIVNQKLKPVMIDLNFACPDKNIVKSGCGGYLMQYPDRIIEIVESAKKATKIPISVKTRAGWDNCDDVFNLANKLGEVGIEALTVHPRTVKSGFRGDPDWNILRKLVQDNPKLAIIGSGSVKNWEDALEKQKESGCTGVMIGRSALGRPWIFKEIKKKTNHGASISEISGLVIDLAQKAEKIWGEKGITESKKHFAWYFKGFPGVSEYRKKLMEAKTSRDVRKILE